MSATLKALEIVARLGRVTPKLFAREMWPDSPGWRRCSKAGNNGVIKGGGMYLAAGGYLGKLSKRKLVTIETDTTGRPWWILSENGRRVLLSLRPRPNA